MYAIELRNIFCTVFQHSVWTMLCTFEWSRNRTEPKWNWAELSRAEHPSIDTKAYTNSENSAQLWQSHRMHELSRVAEAAAAAHNRALAYTWCPQSSCLCWIRYFSYIRQKQTVSQIQSIAAVWSQRFNSCECVLEIQRSNRSVLIKSFDIRGIFRHNLCFIFMFYLHFERARCTKDPKKQQQQKKQRESERIK